MPLAGKVLPGGAAYSYLPASVRRFPGPEDLGEAMRRAGFAEIGWRLLGGGIVALHVARASVSALATVRAAPGLDAYLELLEDRLERSVGSHPGLVGEIGADTLAAGGKRLRPVLVFLCTPREDRAGERAVAGGASVELVHMATLVHDDLLDGADLRRGRPTAWAEHGEGAAKATGDYLFARAFAELTSTGDARAVAVLADAALALARGEALQRRQAFRPDTTVDEYLARCSLKTGKLFEAACVIGGGGPASAPSASRSASRSRSRTTSSTAPATSTRRARRPASTCATARRRCR